MAAATPREPSIDESLVRALLEARCPEWARLPLEPVLPGGWDNRTFRLGAEMSVRLPSAACYAEQVAKEQRWLPRLAPGLPLIVPEPLFEGAATRDYPYSWSVYRWLAGEDAECRQPDDLVCCGLALAEFLRALHGLDAGAGPPPGPHNFRRGGELAVYDAETRDSLELLWGTVDVAAARALWDAALRSLWRAAPVWVHGDLSHSNLLVHGAASAR